MSIDWITVSAQIINFLILVWLLKRFLYRPVMRAMERREQRISNRLEEAREREQQAEQQRRDYEDKQQQIEQQREQKLQQAEQEAREKKNQLLDAAREEADQAQQRWQQQVQQEKREFLDGLQHRTRDALIDTLRRALRDLADIPLEKHLIDSFGERLKALDSDTLGQLRESAGPVVISSAFELESSERSRLTRLVHEHIGEDMEVEYQQDGGLICGIVLSTESLHMGWNLAQYLEDLSERLDEAFESQQARVQ